MTAKPRRSLASLEQLHRQSREHSFALEDLDGSATADRAKPWLPEGIHAVSFLPSCGLLDDQERLRCRQRSRAFAIAA